MQLNEYQEFASSTAVYPNRGKNLIYPVLGLIGELGELTRKVKAGLDNGDILLDCPVASIITRLLDVASSTGETAELLKKSIRAGIVPCSCEVTVRTDTVGIGKELGDGLWYESQTAFELGYPLEQIGSDNIEKLQDRKARGVIQGDGDNR